MERSYRAYRILGLGGSQTVIPAFAGIPQGLAVGMLVFRRGFLDSGPVSEYGVTFFCRNDGRAQRWFN